VISGLYPEIDMGILALGLPSFVRTRYRYCTFSASVGMLLLFFVPLLL
jgi:hypothetical protein